MFERYAAGENGPKAHTKAEEFVYKHEKIEFKRGLDSVATALHKLPTDNEAVQYCQSRNIPIDKYSSLYYIDSAKKIGELHEDYEDLPNEEPRLLIPFYDKEKNLVGVTMRALRGEKLRYITAKFDKTSPLLFGIDAVDFTSPVKVVEGPIDSLFLKNAIACAGTGFNKLEELDLPKAQLQLVFDNQPRNEEVCDIIQKYIDLGYTVCLWPKDIEEKDINEMVLQGIDVEKVIEENLYSGLLAKLKFTEWRKC